MFHETATGLLTWCRRLFQVIHPNDGAAGPFFSGENETEYLSFCPTLVKRSLEGFTVTAALAGAVTSTVYSEAASPTLVSSLVYVTAAFLESPSKTTEKEG